MQEVKIFIETTLAGPCVKDGWYAAMLECQTKKGPATMWLAGMEEKTTYYRSILLAAILALRKLKPCRAIIYTRCSYIIGIYGRDTEWKKPTGEDVKNKDLWQQFLDEIDRLGGKEKIAFQFSKSHVHKDFLVGKMREMQAGAEKQQKKEQEKQEKR